MTSNNFNRQNNFWKVSFAFRRFKKLHTKLNHFYYTNLVHEETTKSKFSELGKPFNIDDLEFDFEPSNIVDSRKYLQSEWIKVNKEYFTWNKLSLLVALSRYLEMYINEILLICSNSNQNWEDSNGLFQDNFPIVVASGLKVDNRIRRRTIDADAHNNNWVYLQLHGSWENRIKLLTHFTGSQLSVFNDSNFVILEKLRIKRNTIGHNFGYEDSREVLTDEDFSDFLMDVLEEEMLNYLGVVYDVVQELDDKLLKKHIGAFELIYILHNNVNNGRLKLSNLHNSIREFRGILSVNYNYGRQLPSKKYVSDLFTYYRSLV